MAVDVDRQPVELLTAAAVRAAAAAGLDDAAGELARAAQLALGADLVVVRAADDEAQLVALAIAPDDVSEAAELAGTRAAAIAEVSPALARVAARAGAADVFAVPVELDYEVVGLVELYRGGVPFSRAERALVCHVGRANGRHRNRRVGVGDRPLLERSNGSHRLRHRTSRQHRWSVHGGGIVDHGELR